MQRATQRDFASVLFSLDSALRRIAPHQLALEQGNAFPEQAVLAVTDIAWMRVREINPTAFEFLVPRIRREFCRYLVRQFERTGHIVFETRVFRFSCDGHCAPDFQSLSEALSEYKGLARIWNAQLIGWCSFVTDFLTHTTTFLQNHDCGQGLETLVDLRTGLSDPHRRGRSVTRVHFTSAGDWFYKPRSGNRELAWSHLLHNLNSAGFDPPFFTPEVRPAPDHCWMRAIPYVEPRSKEERQRFYYRTGSLLYLAHILRAVDLHAANFVIHGEHPVIVDSETFFHPETDMPPAAQVDEDSLARTGVLSSHGSANGNPFVDSSLERLTAAEASARACPQGRDNDEVLGGFEGMHDFLNQAGKDRHIQRAMARLRSSGTRCVFRPTHLYYRILHEALTPPRSRSVASLHRSLRSRLENGLCKTGVVRKEIRQLVNGDIPIFSARPAPGRHPLSKGDFGRAIKDLQSALQRS